MLHPILRPSLVRIGAVAMMLLGAAHLASAESMTLTDRQGRSITAEILSVDDDTVKIKRSDGLVFNLTRSTLTDDDQKKLVAWAAAEAAKPLPPGALKVALSRGAFDTHKETNDVTLTTGRVVKNAEMVTKEKWGYLVSITNTTSQPLPNLRIKYHLYATTDSVHSRKTGLKKKTYESVLETIPHLDKITFRTETVLAIKTKYSGNIVSGHTGDSSSRETLHGIWMRIYRGEELVYEVAMPESLRTTRQW